MISDSSAMARMAANFTLALAVRQNARSPARDSPCAVTPKAHCLRRCRASSSRASMGQDYHGTAGLPQPCAKEVTSSPQRRCTQLLPVLIDSHMCAKQVPGT